MDRVEMKARARQLIARNRARAVLAPLVPMTLYVLLYGLPLFGFIMTRDPSFLFIAIAVAVVFIPLMVGLANFFMQFEKDPKASYGAVWKGYRKENLLRSLGRLLQMFVFIYAWSIFLVFPGVIKSLAYAMTPFILADDDFKDSKHDPITLSRAMMNGHKVEFFVLLLSFIGWMVLGIFTFHVLTVLFVTPYFYQTLALFYQKVKADYNVKVGLVKNTG